MINEIAMIMISTWAASHRSERIDHHIHQLPAIYIIREQNARAAECRALHVSVDVDVTRLTGSVRWTLQSGGKVEIERPPRGSWTRLALFASRPRKWLVRHVGRGGDRLRLVLWYVVHGDHFEKEGDGTETVAENWPTGRAVQENHVELEAKFLSKGKLSLSPRML